ncbi:MULTISPECIES: uroporphyrinogen decarboxylase family protein [unclassified Oceanispirochaeta]|uniref:uroporphyrinogen decarboxylase family protein n=1 Tax=unclassified Oceanispirochaeta TaxID=2635722 RepID=UPI001314DC25|nr:MULTISPECIES: uroporphyrinogen decarboxylase family protein [unclassified Oceanispirochaeta]MBF9016581.1 hypothetical protein [Oceanispirochaeta sp. M2]NPD73044.1 hypothetical protein [Oceanispirochaeta sp. M1]
MTGRERILAVLNKQVPDRIPVTFFVQEEYLSWFYPERKNISRVSDAVDCARHYGFDIITRDNKYTKPYWLNKSYPNWEVQEETWIENDIYYRKTAIKTPGGTLDQIETAPNDPRILKGVHFHMQDYLLKSVESFEIFKKYFPEIDKRELEERRERARYSKNIIGDLGITCPWGIGGVYNSVSSYRNIQELLMDPYIQPDFYHDLMDFFTKWIVKDYQIMTETEFDALGIQGNIANGALMGDDFFSQYILPYEKRISDTIRSGGKFSIYHNCGYAHNLYKSYRELGIDVWETVAPSPMGDNNLREARNFFGEDLILSGNLDQVNFLKRATPDEIRETVKEIMCQGKKGGAFLFSASDYLEPETPEENIKAAVSAAIEWGGLK